MRTFTICFLLLSIKVMGQINISWPIDKAVFQRNNPPYSNATVIFAGQVPIAWTNSYQLQYKVVNLDKYGNEGIDKIGWTNLATPGLGKVFRTSAVLTTGWYKLYVRLLQNGGTIASNYKKFGVGEVFVIAGQSNAAGEGSVSYTDPSNPSLPNSSNYGKNYDCIITSAQSYSNKCSGKLPVYPVLTNLNNSSSYISPNGFQPWVYNYLATKIVDANASVVVPVMVFNTGLSGSSTDQWSQSANSPGTSYSTDPFGINRCDATQNGNGYGLGEPFRTLRNSLNYYGSIFGVRGVIWHQGESDSFKDDQASAGYTSTTYVNNLNNVISKTRTYYSSSLLWYISNVALFIKNGNQAVTSSDVLTGQNSVRTGNATLNLIAADNSDGIKDWSFSGNGTIPTRPPTSQVPVDYYKRQVDNQHFEMKGLVELGNQYYTNISSSFTDKASVPANPIVPVIITQSGSSKVVTVDFGGIGKTASNFNCFFWTQGDTYSAVTYPNYGCSSSDTYSKSFSSAGLWRCYMRENVTGNVYMTQQVIINTDPNVRVANSSIDSKVYPNPNFVGFETTIEFNLEIPSYIKLELVNSEGNVIQELANGMHDIGEYHYPFTMKNRKSAIMDQLYYRITINDYSETKRIILQ